MEATIICPHCNTDQNKYKCEINCPYCNTFFCLVCYEPFYILSPAGGVITQSASGGIYKGHFKDCYIINYNNYSKL
jgi:hypothetical protein